MNGSAIVTWSFSGSIEFFLSVGFGLLCGLIIVLAPDLRFAFQLALFLCFFGAAGLVVTPNRRLALVLAWILVHPLSIEKVFLLGEGLRPEFFGPTLVISASDLIFVLLTVLLVLECVLTGQCVLHWPSAATPWAVLSVWTFFIFLIQNPSLFGTLAVLQSFKLLLFMIVLSSSVRTKRELLLVLAAMAVSVTVQDILVNLAHHTDYFLKFSSKISMDLMTFSGSGGEAYKRATGTVGHVNQTAAFLTFFTLPLLGLLAINKRWIRCSVLVVFVLSFLAVTYTYSRTAWVSLAMSLCVIFFLGFRRKLFDDRFWILIFPVVFVLTVVAAIYSGPIIDRLFSGDEGATASRKRALLLSLDLTRHNFLTGVGPGNFAAATLSRYPPERKDRIWVKPGEDSSWIAGEYGRLELSQATLADGTLKGFPLPVHNKYLLIMTEQGLIGLVLFLWFQWRVFGHARRALMAKNRTVFWSGLGVMAAFWATQAYQQLDLFNDDKTMEILLIVPVMAIIVDHLGAKPRGAEND